VYVDNSAPGIYTLTENGVGSGAILHANYTQVSTSSPAKPGETVLLFMIGLGTVTPQVGDGVAGSSSQLSTSDEAADIFVFLNDEPANVLYAGLAPGFAGLYQVNFTVPTRGVGNGDVPISFNTTEALNTMATISLTGFSEAATRTGTGHRASRLRGRAVAAGGAHGREVKNHRRALPERIVPMQ